MPYLSPSDGGWFVPVSFDVPESDKNLVESEMHKLLKHLGGDLEIPEINAHSVVQAEWQGGGPSSEIPGLNSKEPFAQLPNELKNGPVVLVLHGGGYVTGSPAMERPATFKLSKMSGARIFSVDYRLAPQSPFPAALIDAVLAYKYLIDPPAGAHHEAIDPKKLIIAGDSAGVSSFWITTDGRVV